MKLKRLLKNIICAMVIAEILTITVAIVKNNNTQELAQGKQTMLAESTVIEFNEGVGENLTAKLNMETGELRITGTGKMTNWSWNAVPWYSYREKIKTVVIEKGVTSIGGWVFYLCRSLSKIEIPSSVISIGDDAFEDCSSLSEINIPEGVTSIGYDAFEDCSSLSKIEIPSSVTSIGSSAFNRCSSLSEINVQEENKNYSSVNGILFNKEKTKIVKYPAGKKETSYNIPKGVTSIGWYAFYGCSSLREINIPEGVTSIGSSAFSGCELNIPIELSTEETQEIELPSIIKRAQIKEDILYTDKEFTLKNCTLNESKDKLIVNTKEVKTNMASLYIESGALKGLKLNIIPKEIEYVEGVGENLTAKLNTETGELRITGTGKMINWTYTNENPWYSYRKEIKTVVIEEVVTNIGSYAFYVCSSLSNIEIPSSVTSIGESAFDGCSSLSKIEIPSSVTSIGSSAFSGCSSLSEINIPEGVTSIGDYAFRYCRSLSKIEIPSSVTSIGSTEFYGCSSLKEIKIPEGVTSIGEAAFRYCSSLSKIEIPSSVTSIGLGAFSKCISLSEINIPEGVTSIDAWAFEYCSSLSKIEIPSSVTRIGNYTFDKCDSLIIYCRSNSYAKEYAVNNNINYTEINPEITSVTGNAEEWTHENVTLKVEAKDTMYGLAEEAYSFDGGTTWQKENTKTYSQNTEGIVIKVKAKDGAIATYGETVNITKIKHIEVIDKKVEPKCTQAGLTEGKHCSVCNTVIVAQKEIPALGHNYKDGICTTCGEKETIFINTSTYKIENEKYIRNVKLNTTIEEFKKSIKEEYTVKITKDEKNVTIGTGAKVTVSKNGENIGEYIVVVTGDLTGDGKLQNGDLIKLVRHKVELITLEEPYKLAGDINGDGKISDSDIIKLARVLVSLEQL